MGNHLPYSLHSNSIGDHGARALVAALPQYPSVRILMYAKEALKRRFRGRQADDPDLTHADAATLRRKLPGRGGRSTSGNDFNSNLMKQIDAALDLNKQQEHVPQGTKLPPLRARSMCQLIAGAPSLNAHDMAQM